MRPNWLIMVILAATLQQALFATTETEEGALLNPTEQTLETSDRGDDLSPPEALISPPGGDKPIEDSSQENDSASADLSLPEKVSSLPSDTSTESSTKTIENGDNITHSEAVSSSHPAGDKSTESSDTEPSPEPGEKSNESRSKGEVGSSLEPGEKSTESSSLSEVVSSMEPGQKSVEKSSMEAMGSKAEEGGPGNSLQNVVPSQEPGENSTEIGFLSSLGDSVNNPGSSLQEKDRLVQGSTVTGGQASNPKEADVALEGGMSTISDNAETSTDLNIGTVEMSTVHNNVPTNTLPVFVNENQSEITPILSEDKVQLAIPDNQSSPTGKQVSSPDNEFSPSDHQVTHPEIQLSPPDMNIPAPNVTLLDILQGTRSTIVPQNPDSFTTTMLPLKAILFPNNTQQSPSVDSSVIVFDTEESTSGYSAESQFNMSSSEINSDNNSHISMVSDTLGEGVENELNSPVLKPSETLPSSNPNPTVEMETTPENNVMLPNLATIETSTLKEFESTMTEPNGKILNVTDHPHETDLVTPLLRLSDSVKDNASRTETITNHVTQSSTALLISDDKLSLENANQETDNTHITTSPISSPVQATTTTEVNVPSLGHTESSSLRLDTVEKVVEVTSHLTNVTEPQLQTTTESKITFEPGRENVGGAEAAGYEAPNLEADWNNFVAVLGDIAVELDSANQRPEDTSQDTQSQPLQTTTLKTTTASSASTMNETTPTPPTTTHLISLLTPNSSLLSDTNGKQNESSQSPSNSSINLPIYEEAKAANFHSGLAFYRTSTEQTMLLPPLTPNPSVISMIEHPMASVLNDAPDVISMIEHPNVISMIEHPMASVLNDDQSLITGGDLHKAPNLAMAMQPAVGMDDSGKYTGIEFEVPHLKDEDPKVGVLLDNKNISGHQNNATSSKSNTNSVDIVQVITIKPGTDDQSSSTKVGAIVGLMSKPGAENKPLFGPSSNHQIEQSQTITSNKAFLGPSSNQQVELSPNKGSNVQQKDARQSNHILFQGNDDVLPVRSESNQMVSSMAVVMPGSGNTLRESADIEDLKITKEEVNKMVADIKTAGRMSQMEQCKKEVSSLWRDNFWNSDNFKYDSRGNVLQVDMPFACLSHCLFNKYGVLGDHDLPSTDKFHRLATNNTISNKLRQYYGVSEKVLSLCMIDFLTGNPPKVVVFSVSTMRGDYKDVSCTASFMYDICMHRKLMPGIPDKHIIQLTLRVLEQLGDDRNNTARTQSSLESNPKSGSKVS